MKFPELRGTYLAHVPRTKISKLYKYQFVFIIVFAKEPGTSSAVSPLICSVPGIPRALAHGVTLIYFIFKRNAKAFSLTAIVDVRRRLRRRHEMIFLIYRKLFELATSKFTAM